MSYVDPIGENLTLEKSKEKESLHESPAPVNGTSSDEQNDSNIFPYLLINIGSCVNMIEVTGKEKFERITGSHLGVGTILDLARLLASCSSYEEFMELSQRGNSLSVDLTIGDIYGEEGCPKVGLPVSTIASSFGKVNSSKLSDYNVEDLAASLLHCFTFNIAQIACFVAKLSGLKRIFFRGAYVCTHEKTMDMISHSLRYQPKGEVQIAFMCHEGFMGTEGASWSYKDLGIDSLAGQEDFGKVLLGAPYTRQFQTLPLTEQQEIISGIYQQGGNETLKGKVESLWHDSAILKGEVELVQVQRENTELKAKLVDNAILKAEIQRLQQENAELKSKVVISSEVATIRSDENL